ncbi:MAG: endolytic transglycosylase MltG, partial [Brachybacterium sp.]|nr:endolytic transglycosylase MltG [Brachybacterium sp.]
MNDEDLSFDELAETQGEMKRSTRRGRRRAPRRGGLLRRALPVLLVLLVLGGLVYGGMESYRWVTSNVSVEEEASDFEGPGHDEVPVEVAAGDTGTDVANTLVEEGVIKSIGPFVSLFSNTPDAAQIEPGIYSLRLEMTSADALNALMDPTNLAGHRVIIPEGKRLTQIWEQFAAETEIPVEDFEAAAKDYTSYGIPENEAGTLEGYLLPGRYDIYEDQTAEDVIELMWGRMEEELTAREIP